MLLPTYSLSDQPRYARIRRTAQPLFALLLRLVTQVQVRGVEHIPLRGPLIIAFNHLGHLDPLLLYLTMPIPPEIIGLAEAWSLPLIGRLVHAYGGIPVQRDQFDRAVVENALAILANGLMLAVAPEARFSSTGALERARTGVAYLAMKSRAPVMPVAITGTQLLTERWRAARRGKISITYGERLTLPRLPPNAMERRNALRSEADGIMRAIAAMLPEAYRGVYKAS